MLKNGWRCSRGPTRDRPHRWTRRVIATPNFHRSAPGRALLHRMPCDLPIIPVRELPVDYPVHSNKVHESCLCCSFVVVILQSEFVARAFYQQHTPTRYSALLEALIRIPFSSSLSTLSTAFGAPHFLDSHNMASNMRGLTQVR